VKHALQLAHLSNLNQCAGGSAWLSKLPERVERVCADWKIESVSTPYLESTVSYVVPAQQTGVPVVLKFQWPHEECLYEAEALRQWNGNGAVQLLAHNPNEYALLLEQCNPGQTLTNTKLVDKLSVVIGILPTLWIPASAPFRTLEQEARGWQSRLLGYLRKTNE